MPNPAWITSENVKFNGTLDNAAVLKTAVGVRSLILWDNLSESDKTVLTSFIAAHGNALPLAGPTAGSQTVDFVGSVVGANATGLNNVATATAGVATVNVGGAKTGASLSGLSSSAGTHGAQVANFSTTITGATSTGLLPFSGYQYINFTSLTAGSDATNYLVDTAGYQVINVGGAKTGASATGLVGVTTYTASVSVDGAANAISILGSAAQTYTTLLAEINADLTGAVATLVAGNIKITSSSTGVVSVIAVTDTDLFSSLTGYVAILTAVDGTQPVYTSTITVDGVAKSISVVGSAAQTFTTLVSEINADLGASATATLDTVNHRIVITSATFGITSTVLVVQGTLFAAPLANFSSITAAVRGNANAALTATVVVDGVSKAISVLPTAVTLFSNLITEINTDLGAAATAAVSNGDIVITSATTGITSTVVITAGTLFPALPGFSNLLPAQNGGGTARTYSAIVIVDGVIKSVRFSGIEGDTYTHVISEINTDLGASATASISGGNIIITSATTGTNSSVKIYDAGSLFSSLTSYVGFSDVLGTAPVNYTATIVVDGATKAISVQGSAAQTFTTLVSEINTDLGAAATAAISGGNIVITSATTGVASKVLVTEASLFKVVGAIGVLPPVNGITDLLAAAKVAKSPNGGSLLDTFDVITVGVKPAVLPNTPHTTKFIYWDGAVWKYLDDDTNV